ncbi:spermatogenesis-associated protein 6 isoform X2 [Anas platyrhynchos]|uniref:spermatogenesis-associated protein 6 isoform X2 n=1 Tax=Anas platyrhynchos TaxID=8839 RepID=UPI000F7C7F43|nr:spermatogenesis-associated protein 6 isoform X2 [Anas platyrhynchos]|eukprot:XP_027318661.1 spermatogenesis-associated protein 6 isoform X4 [Anas platyrhynchos]
MARRALRCVLRLEIREITCPGVQLKDKEELYLSVSLLGQYKKTRRVPAAFPLFFQEKLVFEKTFADIVDPADLVKLLEFDTAVLELIQLVPPGEILATYEENTRDFLFPDPKLTRRHHGLDREILMKRSSSFTGIAPKLRFSTSSLITESLLSSGRSHIQDDLNWVHHSTPNGKLQTKLPKKITLSPEKSRHSIVTKNYEQPTIASKSRSPSPYTKRRMCELSEEARQRLAHLNLGPYEFRRETDKPPFVVRRVEQQSPGSDLHAWCTLRESTVGAWSKVTHDPSLLGSYKPKRAKAKSTHGKDCDSSSDVCNEDVISGPPNRQPHSAGSLVHSAPSAFQKHSPSSVLNRSSLRERFNAHCPPPANGDEIHKRVKNILRTHSARQRLVFNESNSSKGDLTKTRDSSHKAHLSMSELQSSSPVQRNTTVHLDNGEYWSSRAAVYKGKSHRAIFEDSLEKIYRNMYRKASGIVSDQKPHS